MTGSFGIPTCAANSVGCPVVAPDNMDLAGPPGSDPPITLPATVTNAGSFVVVGNLPIAPISMALSPFSNSITFFERGNVGQSLASFGAAMVYDYNIDTNQLYSRSDVSKDMFCIGGVTTVDGTLYAIGGVQYDGQNNAVRVRPPGGSWAQNNNIMKLQNTRYCKFFIHVRSNYNHASYGGNCSAWWLS